MRSPRGAGLRQAAGSTDGVSGSGTAAPAATQAGAIPEADVGPVVEADRVDSGAAGVDVALQARVATLEGEMRAMRAQVAALFELERFRDVVLVRHASYPAPPPPARRLDARDFVDAADGFHNLEYDGQGTAYRWTGPGHFTRARFHIDRSVPVAVALRLSSLGVHTDLDRITVDVDGTVYPMRRLGGQGIALGAGPVPPREEGGLTELFFHIPRLFSPSDTGFNDERKLGVAVLSIEVAPES